MKKKSGTPTKYPGVLKLATKSYRIRGKVMDPRTGKPKEVDRIIDDVTLPQAARVRAELLEQLRRSNAELPAQRLRVGEYAQLWMRSKASKIEPRTASEYADCLDRHILPALGDFYYDAMTRRDVQGWVDKSLTTTWKTQGKKPKQRGPYSVETVRYWYRVLRSMTRDAIGDLDLDRDPTARIEFPKRARPTEARSLSPDELVRVLREMHRRYPQHFAFTVTLVFSGLRFCHASALKWEDWDEASGVIRVHRKQVWGIVGPVTRQKPAGVCVVEPELAKLLREHRRKLLREQNPGNAEGWMFPTPRGKLRTQPPLGMAIRTCVKAAGIKRRFTIHGTRFTFTDLTRKAGADAMVRRALVGHLSEAMQEHYSHVAIEEKRAAVAGVYRLVPLASVISPSGGDPGGDTGAASEPAIEDRKATD